MVLWQVGALALNFFVLAAVPFGAGAVVQLVLRSRKLPVLAAWTIALLPAVVGWIIGLGDGVSMTPERRFGALITVVWNWGFILIGASFVQKLRERRVSDAGAGERGAQESVSPEA